jgi:hypothetical protein
MAAIGRGVGKGGFNNPQDVKVIQDLLNKSPAVNQKIPVDGSMGVELTMRLFSFKWPLSRVMVRGMVSSSQPEKHCGP